ncbi:MAG: hypothetical protein WBH51_07005 [Mycolicibacter algericus]|uniref:hypothetical protein n=1 Tax=Mycolicibacter algericus TaxID=1288388 RepID=UPI003C712DEE
MQTVSTHPVVILGRFHHNGFVMARYTGTGTAYTTTGKSAVGGLPSKSSSE